ncbi:MAG: hypothetical protein HY039_01765 [Nitrospirae bacterium]|nr:hypothetical protein [Nitrospirota bacterium]
MKLTQSGAKEAVLSALDVSIPPAVRREVVDEGKTGGYPDALIVEENIAKGRLKTAGLSLRRTGESALLVGGEKEVLGLYLEGRFDAVASDDSRFLKKMESLNVPYLTAAACIAYLSISGRAGRKNALDLLEKLRRHISDDEYSVVRLFLEGKT